MSERARFLLRQALAGAAAIWVVLFVALAIRGGVRNFSPIPYWDMWVGYVDFYNRVLAGDAGVWWSLHNEHRIVLARALFWLDLELFGGGTAFLIAVNFLLALGIALTFGSIFRAQAERAGHPAWSAYWLLPVVLMFSWVQQDNLIWAFQSQFFLAQWVPLVALYLLARALPESPASARWFAAACAAGVASVGTMASGILALPLMTAYALLVRMPWRRVGMLAGLSVLCLAAYFHGYETPGGHGSARDLVTREPALLAQYVLLYLGSPAWYALIRWTDDAAFIAQVAGALLLLLTGVRAAAVLRSPRAHGLSLAMLFFVGYILATALGTAAGRLVFGLIQAASSRYTTPALMAWLALLAAWLPVLMGRRGLARAGLVLALLVVLVPLTKFQFQAQKDRSDILFQRELAALAVEMRVRDEEQIAHVVYKTDVALDVAARMAAHPAGAWTQPWQHGVNDLPGDTVDRPQGPACRGGIDAVSPLGDERFVRVAGWIDPGGDANARSGIAIVDAAGAHVGHAVVGPALQQGATPRAFAGYLLRSSATDVARFVHLPSGCSFSGALRPRLAPFRLLPTLATLHRINVTAGQVVDNHDWTGSDFERTQWPDLRVLGSWRTGDADVASVTLQLRRGDVLFYRTGPGRGGQTFAVTSPEGGQLFGGELPPSNPWRGLLFDNEWLPERFLLTLRDDGRGWGQWAAIGVRETASRP